MFLFYLSVTIFHLSSKIKKHTLDKADSDDEADDNGIGAIKRPSIASSPSTPAPAAKVELSKQRGADPDNSAWDKVCIYLFQTENILLLV